MKELQLFVLNDKEEAAYFYNDLLTFYDEENVRFLPSSFRRTGNFEFATHTFEPQRQLVPS